MPNSCCGSSASCRVTWQKPLSLHQCCMLQNELHSSRVIRELCIAVPAGCFIHMYSVSHLLVLHQCCLPSRSLTKSLCQRITEQPTPSAACRCCTCRKPARHVQFTRCHAGSLLYLHLRASRHFRLKNPCAKCCWCLRAICPLLPCPSPHLDAPACQCTIDFPVRTPKPLRCDRRA